MKTLTFAALRAANEARLPLFKNSKGEPAHSEPDGSDWAVDSWTNALCGEAGEAANFAKKLLRGDLDLDEAREKIGKELADVVIYADLTAKRLGLDLGQCVVSKFNEVSERIGVVVTLDCDRDVTLASLHTDVLDVAAGIAQLQMTLDEMSGSERKLPSNFTVYGKAKIGGAAVSAGGGSGGEAQSRATSFSRAFESPYGGGSTQPKRVIPIHPVEVVGGAPKPTAKEIYARISSYENMENQINVFHAHLRPAFEYINHHRDQFPDVHAGELLTPTIASCFVEWAEARATTKGKSLFYLLNGYALSYEQMAKNGAEWARSVAHDFRQNIIPQSMGCDPYDDGPEMAQLQTWLNENGQAYRKPGERMGLAGWALRILKAQHPVMVRLAVNARDLARGAEVLEVRGENIVSSQIRDLLARSAAARGGA